MQARLFVVATILWCAACSQNEKPAAEAGAEPAAATPASADTPAVPADKGVPAMPLQTTDLAPGSGAEIRKDQTALVHYTGWLFEAAAPENKGKQFDSSVGGQPFEFQLGAGHVIAGWDQGVLGMKAGGKRRLVIPPELGYGAKGAGQGLIPPGATLVFDVELVEIR
jgi:FKBP-type peptidyl-prolyl cis-trans isomerase